MTDFRPSGKNRLGVVSRAQHRFVSAFRPSSLPILPEGVRNRRVLRYQEYSVPRGPSSVANYGREERTLLGPLCFYRYHILCASILQANFPNKYICGGLKLRISPVLENARKKNAYSDSYSIKICVHFWQRTVILIENRQGGATSVLRGVHFDFRGVQYYWHLQL